jgi:hypothetical protein
MPGFSRSLCSAAKMQHRAKEERRKKKEERRMT